MLIRPFRCFLKVVAAATAIVPPALNPDTATGVRSKRWLCAATHRRTSSASCSALGKVCSGPLR